MCPLLKEENVRTVGSMSLKDHSMRYMAVKQCMVDVYRMISSDSRGKLPQETDDP